MNRNLEKRVADLEAKNLVDDEAAKRATDLEEKLVILKIWDYHRKQREMTMTVEDRKKYDVEMTEKVVQWYGWYQNLSPKKKAIYDKKQVEKSAADLERNRAFLASEEYKRFEAEYEAFCRAKREKVVRD